MTNQVQRYMQNPFKKEVITQTITGTRAIYASPTKENSFAMVDRITGEDKGDITFGKRITVDKTHFMKLYADGVKMFLGLKSAGIKVFMLIYDSLMKDKNYQADNVMLSYEMLDKNIQKKISRTVFYSGLRELKKVNFLAPAALKGVYWINPNYIFRGDRLTLVNQYILDMQEEKTSINPPLIPPLHKEVAKKAKQPLPIKHDEFTLEQTMPQEPEVGENNHE